MHCPNINLSACVELLMNLNILKVGQVSLKFIKTLPHFIYIYHTTRFSLAAMT